MDRIISVLYRIFVMNWSRKVVAFFAAVILWFSVSQSITMTTTLSDIPVKIINVPQGKTIIGMQPDGHMQKKIAITVTGKRSVVSELNPHNIEIIVNAEGRKTSWIPKIDKSTLISLTSNIDPSEITSLSSKEFLLDLKDEESLTDES